MCFFLKSTNDKFEVFLIKINDAYLTENKKEPIFYGGKNYHFHDDI